MIGSVNMKKIQAILLTAISLAAVFCAPISAFAATTYIRGDADGDGHVDIRDVTAIQRHLAELEHLNSAIQMYLAEYDDPYQVGKTFTYDEYELPFMPN